MAQITFSTVQAQLASALTAIAGVSGSLLAGIPVVTQTYQSMVPDTDGTRLDPLLKAALAEKGLCLFIGLPGTSARDMAENAANLLNLAPPLSLHINPTKNFGAGGLDRDPHAILDELVPALLGRASASGGQGMQRWHLAAAPVSAPVETRLGLMIAINVMLPAHFRSTAP